MRRQAFLWLLLLLGLLCMAGCGTEQEAAVQVLNLTDAPMTETQARQLQELALTEALEYQEYIAQVGPSETANLTLQQEQIVRVVQLFADRGRTVVAAENHCSMENPEPARNFGRAVQRGEDASLVCYRIYADGGFSRSEFVCRNGAASLTNVRVAWDNSLTPQVVSVSKRDLPELRYTEKGYLIYRMRELDSVASGPDYVPYQMIRVEPLDDTCRELCSTYIRPAGYVNHNLFLTDWSQEDYGELVWNDLFPVCYFLETGTLLTSHQCAGYSFSASSGLLIPAEDYGRYIGCYFAIDPAELERRSYRDPDSGCYPTRIFTSGDMSRRLPVPEVVAWNRNADGTLTLTVEALDVESGTDCAFSNQVTVLPRDGGGWYYLANQLLCAESGQLPAYENPYPD